MERCLKHVSVPTLCWAEIRSQAGLRHLDLGDNLTDQEYGRIIAVSVKRMYCCILQEAALIFIGGTFLPVKNKPSPWVMEKNLVFVGVKRMSYIRLKRWASDWPQLIWCGSLQCH